MIDAIDFARLIGPVCERLWGPPNERLSNENELRWGNGGSRVVSLSKGTWFDHEAGVGGGVLDLLQRDAGCNGPAAAMQWLKQHGLINDSRAAQAKRNADAEAQEKKASRDKAYYLLRAAALANAGAPTDYLNGRGIGERIPDNVMLLPTTATVVRLTGKRYPCMVVPITNGECMQGAQITWLSADCTTKLAVSGGSARRTYGKLTGGFVRLGRIEPDKPVVVAEGVETALAARQLAGLPAAIATLSAGNMRALPVPEEKCEIIIAADNDRRGTGQQAAEALADRLASHGKQVRIALPQRAEDGDNGDWNDALKQAGGDVNKLAELREAILRAKPFVRSNTQVTGYALTMEQALSLQVPPRQYLLEPWLETAATAMIFAKRGTYKTHFAMSVAYAIATGGELLGWKVHKAARVLYVDGELPTALLQKRLQLLGTPTDNLVILSRDIMLRTRERTLPDLGQEEGRKFLDQIIETQQIGVVMLDSLSTLIRSGIENEAESWAPIQDWMLLHRFRERSVVLVHHEGKSGHQRGTTKREDVLDTIIRLKEREQAEGDDEGVFELRFEKTRGFYGIDTAPLIVRLATKSGTAQWSRETVKDHVRDRVRELSQQDLPQKEIAKEVGLTQSRVSQILSEIRAEKTQG